MESEKKIIDMSKSKEEILTNVAFNFKDGQRLQFMKEGPFRENDKWLFFKGYNHEDLEQHNPIQVSVLKDSINYFAEQNMVGENLVTSCAKKGE